jgi:hypothetical protein
MLRSSAVRFWSAVSFAPVVGLLFTASAAHGATLAQWSFDSGVDDAATNVAAHITPSSFALSTALTNNGFQWSGTVRTHAFSQVGNPTAALALDQQRYVEVSITVEDGYSVNLSNLSFISRNGMGSDGSYNAFVRWNLDNYASDVVAAVVTEGGWGWGGQTVSQPLSATGVTGDVTVRIYTYNAGWDQVVGHDEIVLEGTVVPEPAALSLLALGGLCMLSRRRRDAMGE